MVVQLDLETAVAVEEYLEDWPKEMDNNKIKY
jgi:hypothetical protein